VIKMKMNRILNIGADTVTVEARVILYRHCEGT